MADGLVYTGTRVYIDGQPFDGTADLRAPGVQVRERVGQGVELLPSPALIDADDINLTLDADQPDSWRRLAGPDPRATLQIEDLWHRRRPRPRTALWGARRRHNQLASREDRAAHTDQLVTIPNVRLRLGTIHRP